MNIMNMNILRLENTDVLRMANFDDNLNHPSPPGCSKREATHSRFELERLGLYSKRKSARPSMGSIKEKIGTRGCTRPQFMEEDIHD